MKVYIVVDLFKNKPPAIIGVYKNRNDAEKNGMEKSKGWMNIIEKKVE